MPNRKVERFLLIILAICTFLNLLGLLLSQIDPNLSAHGMLMAVIMGNITPIFAIISAIVTIKNFSDLRLRYRIIGLVPLLFVLIFFILLIFV